MINFDYYIGDLDFIIVKEPYSLSFLVSYIEERKGVVPGVYEPWVPKAMNLRVKSTELCISL